jgi:hypothetical protein
MANLSSPLQLFLNPSRIQIRTQFFCGSQFLPLLAHQIHFSRFSLSPPLLLCLSLSLGTKAATLEVASPGTTAATVEVASPGTTASTVEVASPPSKSHFHSSSLLLCCSIPTRLTRHETSWVIRATTEK